MSTQKILQAGAWLSNIVYNLQQNENIPLHVRESMRECYKQWDDAVTEYRQQVKIAKQSTNKEYEK